MDNLGRSMTAEDAVISATLAFAPYDQVMPAVAGLARAEFGYCGAKPDPRHSLIAEMKQLSQQETQTNVSYVYGVLVAEPEDAPGTTVIEDWYGPDRRALGGLLPDVSFLSLFSLYENKTCEQHRYAWQSGPDILRDVSLDRNMCQNGWCWHEDGPEQPWEAWDRLSAKPLSKRSDRALLFNLSKAHGVDLQRTLGDRRLKRSVLFWQISEWDAREDQTPTQVGDDFHKIAVMAGYGNGEMERSFSKQVEDARDAQAALVSHDHVTRKLRRLRSVAAIHTFMQDLGPAPDGEYAAYMFMLCWLDAINTVAAKFATDPKTRALAEMAIAKCDGLDGGFMVIKKARALL